MYSISSHTKASVFFVFSVIFASAYGCQGGNHGGDGKNDAFHDPLKGDNLELDEACKLQHTVAFLNDPSTDSDTLAEVLAAVSTGARAADNIVAHRDGPDGVFGTADDNLFDGLPQSEFSGSILFELDEVPFVGPRAMEELQAEFSSQFDLLCLSEAINLSDRPFVDADKMAAATNGAPRDELEIEVAMTLQGSTGAAIRDRLLDTNNAGRTRYERITRSTPMEGFSYEFPIDEIPWRGSAHAARRAMPFVALSIESGRFESDLDTECLASEPAMVQSCDELDDDDCERTAGCALIDVPERRELDLAEDINDDIYFDDYAFRLFENDLVLRSRARWRDADDIRRVLVAAKKPREIQRGLEFLEELGIKNVRKVDQRNDFDANTALETLAEDVQNGGADWASPFAAVKEIYDELAAVPGELPEIDGHQGVLLLDPRAHVRSLRSRYHHAEVSEFRLLALQDNAREKVQELIDVATDRLSDPDLNSDEEDILVTLVDDAEALLQFGDASQTQVPTSVDEINDMRLAAEAQRDAYAAFAVEDGILDEADRILSNARDDDQDELADWFVEVMRYQNPQGRAAKRTYEAFISDHEAMTANFGGADGAVAEFNQWAQALSDAGNDELDDFEPLAADDWDAVLNHLYLEQFKTYQGQIEVGGLMATAIWFNQARVFYVPGSRRNTGDFTIDTLDFADMLTHDAWEGLSDDEKRIDRALPAQSVYHSVLVNEVQIELTAVAPYVDRIQTLQADVDAGVGDEEMLEGAKFVLRTYAQSLRTLAELKGEDLVDSVEGGDARDLSWETAERSKGLTALELLRNL